MLKNHFLLLRQESIHYEHRNYEYSVYSSLNSQLPRAPEGVVRPAPAIAAVEKVRVNVYLLPVFRLRTASVQIDICRTNYRIVYYKINNITISTHRN